MPQALKLVRNCLIVAALTFAGFVTMLWLPILPFDPTLWGGQHFEILTVMGMWFVYTIALWGVLGGLIAWCMLALKPRRILLYGIASVATFIITADSWYLVQDEHTYAYLRELIFVLTIPYLYWVFVRVARRKEHQLSVPESRTAGKN